MTNDQRLMNASALERKLHMYQAREAILSRIGSETFSVINPDHFLQATVTEVGKMMGVDRCDVMTLTQQIAIGYRYTHIYSEKEKEARITKALLDIANDINTGLDFNEVIERILDRALDLLNIQAACLAVLDATNSEIHFTNLRTTGAEPGTVLKRPSLKFPILELLPKTVERGQMLKVLSPAQHEYARSFLSEVFSVGASIVVPILIEDKIFGALILLWAQPQPSFAKDASALATGTASQLAIA